MNPLDALFADLTETVGNALLNLDSDAKERLADLDGRCIRIECTGFLDRGERLPNESAFAPRNPPPTDRQRSLPRPGKVATLKVQRSRIAVSAEAIGEADAVVQGSMADLIAWLAAGAQADSSAVRIEGNLGALAEIMAAITPNLMSQLSNALPYGPGEDLLGALELAAAGLRSAAEGAAHAIEQGRKHSPQGSDPLALLTPAFEVLREGALQLALWAQELTKPSRGDPS